MDRLNFEVYIDDEHGRLIYIGSDADERHWDKQWKSLLTREAICRADPFVVSQTKRRLPAGARVLDAGCGLSHTVWGLHHAGFDAYGIDFAPDTVATVNRLAPELKVREADVRSLPFEDNFFDGIWSLGVIEHFPAGFTEIIQEMRRVIRPGGYAFVTVPSMSPLRKLKAQLGAYSRFKGDMTNFYQFVLQPDYIISQFENVGLGYDGGSPRGGFKGLKDEAGLLKPLLQSIYDSENAIGRYFRAAANRALAPVTFHTRFYRFVKL